MTLMGLIIAVLVLGLVAYIVTFLKLPEPYGKVLQVVLLVVLIIVVVKFAMGGGLSLGL